MSSFILGEETVVAKIFLTDMTDGSGLKSLVGEGKMLKFSYNGTCLGEYPLSFDYGTMQESDIVSILMQGSSIELAYNIGGVFRKHKTLRGIGEVAKVLNNMQGVLFVGKRDGSDGGETYTQYLYVFSSGVLPQNFQL